MASSGFVLECLLESQSSTIPGVNILWQAMQACVCGLKGAQVSFCFFSDAIPKDAKKTTAKKVTLNLIIDAIAPP